MRETPQKEREETGRTQDGGKRAGDADSTNMGEAFGSTRTHVLAVDIDRLVLRLLPRVADGAILCRLQHRSLAWM